VVHKTPPSPKPKWTRGIVQAVEHLLCALLKHKGLSSNPNSTTKIKPQHLRSRQPTKAAQLRNGGGSLHVFFCLPLLPLWTPVLQTPRGTRLNPLSVQEHCRASVGGDVNLR
jgi:hypothetical protein